MRQPFSAPDGSMQVAPRSSRAALITAAAAAVGLLLAVGSIGLWVHYGTAVFFEMVKSGIAACM